MPSTLTKWIRTGSSSAFDRAWFADSDADAVSASAATDQTKNDEPCDTF